MSSARRGSAADIHALVEDVKDPDRVPLFLEDDNMALVTAALVSIANFGGTMDSGAGGDFLETAT